MSEAPPALTLFYQLAVAAVLLAGIAFALGETAPARMTPVAVASVLFQGVVVSFFSYFAWFWLMRRYLASLFGVGFGVLVLDEPLSIGFVVGALLVLLGISLVSGAAWLRKRFA
ncbi:EamA-like transporter family protein [compost metagenome]